MGISIHALLAESDDQTADHRQVAGYFNPRSPCGERPGHDHPPLPVPENFNPRSPCGERREFKVLNLKRLKFQSTLSLRRATSMYVIPAAYAAHFNPRSPCGERRPPHPGRARISLFQSTLSLRRATARRGGGVQGKVISIHALLAESDTWMLVSAS